MSTRTIEAELVALLGNWGCSEFGNYFNGNINLAFKLEYFRWTHYYFLISGITKDDLLSLRVKELRAKLISVLPSQDFATSPGGAVDRFLIALSRDEQVEFVHVFNNSDSWGPGRMLGERSASGRGTSKSTLKSKAKQGVSKSV